MDLFKAVPALRHHPLLCGKQVALVGVSTIVRDETASYFEISKPKYWRSREDGNTTVGVGSIGGTIERGESVLDCLRREVAEELGARVRLVPSVRTYLVNEWQVADAMELPASKKRLPPLMVVLTKPQLGGPGTPDHLAILAFRTRLRDDPAPSDLFGLLRIEDAALADFFARDEMPLAEAQARPGLTVTLNGDPPEAAVLRPVLSARAFQSVVRAGYANSSV
jgi:8-oxo-dGTP pyrophosphatase MutT (NUDIX family)